LICKKRLNKHNKIKNKQIFKHISKYIHCFHFIIMNLTVKSFSIIKLVLQIKFGGFINHMKIQKNKRTRFKLGITTLSMILSVNLFLSGCLYKEVVADKQFTANSIPEVSEPMTSQPENSELSQSADEELQPQYKEDFDWVWVPGVSKTSSSSQTPSKSPSGGSSNEDDEDVIVDVSGKKISDIGFGFYHLGPDSLGLSNNGEMMMASDYVNTIISSPWVLPMAAKYKVRVWIDVRHIYDTIVRLASMGADSTAWHTTFDNIEKSVIDSGYEKSCLGWYIDEPTDMEAVKIISKYAQKYGRRFFVMFMVNTVSPRSYEGFKQEKNHTNRDYTQYLTDVGFDCYWGVKSNRTFFDNIIADMHATCPEDAYVWYVPNTYASKSAANSSRADLLEGAKFRIDDLNEMYALLKAEKKPGGLLCFSYDFDDDGEYIMGINVLNKKTNNGWKTLLDECVKIGREICSGKMGK